MKHHVVLYSGGLMSWGVADWVVHHKPGERITLLFTDTLIEDADLYRFLDETIADFGDRVEFVTITDGRTPWEVFRKERMIGNSRLDPCSKLLKRVPTRRWLKANCDPEHTIVYIGFGWDEINRLERARKHWEWTIDAPLTRPPYHTKQDLIETLAVIGIEAPRLYARGYAHNNCGGACVKAGQGHFAHLYADNPALYLDWEREEQEMREFLEKDVSILKQTSGGSSRSRSD